MKETASRKIRMLNENTIEIKYSDNFTIELEDAKKDYAEYDAIVKKKPY